MSTTEHAAGAVRTPPDEQDLLTRVRQAWADVLDADDADRVPLDTNFLEAGGSSLLLIMLWEELSDVSTRPLKVSDLFQHSTVRAQTAFLAGADGAQTVGSVPGAHDRRQLLSRTRFHQVPTRGPGAIHESAREA